jgi:hypothetical protein
MLLVMAVFTEESKADVVRVPLGLEPEIKVPSAGRGMAVAEYLIPLFIAVSVLVVEL